MTSRAVVFPGQGTSAGEISGRVEEVVRGVVGDGDVPYQLSVFARSVEVFHALRTRGVEFEVAAGHSLGEYAAAHAAGSLALEEAARLVAERDRLMREASRRNPGGMVAVIGVDPEEVVRVVEGIDGVVAANFNSPRQTVVSGREEALEEAVSRLGGRKIPLKVSGAFHSPLMAPAAEEMDRLLGEALFGEPSIPMISAVDGSLLKSAEQIRSALRRQMLSPVRWVSVVERMVGMGIEEVVEAGEGGTLLRMLRDFGEKPRGIRAEELLA